MKTYFSRRVALTYLFTIKLLERFSYYGFRVIIVLYAVNESLGLELERETALHYYGILTTLVSLLPFPLGVLSDRWLGHRNGILGGLIIATLGCGILAAGGFTAAAIGSLLIVLGTSLSSVNMPILIGDHFKRSDGRRNVAFLLFYLVINIGAFLGSLWLGLLADEYNFYYAFGIAALALLLAIGLFFAVQSKLPVFDYQLENEVDTDVTILDAELTQLAPKEQEPLPNSTMLTIIIITIGCGLFWSAYDSYNGAFYERVAEMETLQIFGVEIMRSWLYSFNSIFSFIALFILPLLWWKQKKGNSIYKIAMGCLLLAVSLFLLQFALYLPIEQFLNIAIFPAILLGIAEILIAPISMAYITRLSNPRHAATIYGGYILVLYIFSLLISSVETYFSIYQLVVMASGVMLLTGGVLLIGKKILVRWAGGID